MILLKKLFNKQNNKTKQVKKSNTNKGFTLIELIIVMIVIGLLSILGLGKANQFKVKADGMNITSTITTMETAVFADVLTNDDLYMLEDGKTFDKDLILEAVSKEEVYSKSGLLVEGDLSELDGDFYLLKETYVNDMFKNSLAGDYLLSNNGTVIYIK